MLEVHKRSPLPPSTAAAAVMWLTMTRLRWTPVTCLSSCLPWPGERPGRCQTGPCRSVWTVKAGREGGVRPRAGDEGGRCVGEWVGGRRERWWLVGGVRTGSEGLLLLE